MRGRARLDTTFSRNPSFWSKFDWFVRHVIIRVLDLFCCWYRPISIDPHRIPRLAVRFLLDCLFVLMFCPCRRTSSPSVVLSCIVTIFTAADRCEVCCRVITISHRRRACFGIRNQLVAISSVSHDEVRMVRAACKADSSQRYEPWFEFVRYNRHLDRHKSKTKKKRTQRKRKSDWIDLNSDSSQAFGKTVSVKLFQISSS